MEFYGQITNITTLTPTVKSFEISLETNEFAFLPGQWVDFYIEDDQAAPLIGGFTMVSSPTTLGSIELAIKVERGGSPAVYLHNEANIGDRFKIIGPGGDFVLHNDGAKSVCFIAGGIGINPFMSMLNYIDAKNLNLSVTLLYSAKTPSELVFYERLITLSQRNRSLDFVPTITTHSGEAWDGRVGRIDASLLEQTELKEQTEYYLCGPPGMPTEIAGMLKQQGIDQDKIFFEEW